MRLDELEQWKKLIKKEHQYYDTNRDKIMLLEALEEREGNLARYHFANVKGVTGQGM